MCSGLGVSRELRPRRVKCAMSDRGGGEDGSQDDDSPPNRQDSDMALMVEDGAGSQGPPWLQAILRNIQDSQHKALLSTCTVLMIESGYGLAGSSSSTKLEYDVRVLRGLPDTLPMSYSSNGILTVNLVLGTTPVQLVGVPMDDILLLNVHVDGLITKTTCLMLTQHISSSLELLSPRILSLQVRELAASVKATVVQTKGPPLPAALPLLPLELLITIATYLDPNSFLKLTSTCTALRNTLYPSEHVWRVYSLRLGTDPKPDNVTWADWCRRLHPPRRSTGLLAVCPTAFHPFRSPFTPFPWFPPPYL